VQRIRLAYGGDSNQIVDLIRNSFDKDILSALLYGCKGISSYIKEQILVPNNLSDTKYFVAEDAGSISGCIELRLMKDAIFLNYICTSQQKREKGLGNKMLYHAIEHVKTRAHSKMSLDVFINNSVARQWYENLGFSEEYRIDWWKIPVVVKGNDPGYVSGYPQASKCYNEWGFSSFTTMTQSSSYSVGCLGPSWFRITDPALLDDQSAMACLKTLDPDRMILGLFRDDSRFVVPDNAMKFCTSARMSVALDELLQTLKERLV